MPFGCPEQWAPLPGRWQGLDRCHCPAQTAHTVEHVDVVYPLAPQTRPELAWPSAALEVERPPSLIVAVYRREIPVVCATSSKHVGGAPSGAKQVRKSRVAIR